MNAVKGRSGSYDTDADGIRDGSESVRDADGAGDDNANDLDGDGDLINDDAEDRDPDGFVARGLETNPVDADTDGDDVTDRCAPFGDAN